MFRIPAFASNLKKNKIFVISIAEPRHQTHAEFQSFKHIRKLN